MKFKPGQFVVCNLRPNHEPRTGFIWDCWDVEERPEPHYQVSLGDSVVLVPESALELSELSQPRRRG